MEYRHGNGHVWINNSLHSTVGNICMDMMFIDVTNKKVKINDRVEIFGNNYSIIEMAKSINTIPYEIISTISNRVVRVYQKD